MRKFKNKDLYSQARRGVKRCSLDLAFWLNLNYKPLLYNAVLLMIQSDSHYWIRKIVSSTSYRYFPRTSGCLYFKANPLISICSRTCYAKNKKLHKWDKAVKYFMALSSSQSRAQCGSVHEQPRWWMKPRLSWRVQAVKMEGTVEKGRKSINSCRHSLEFPIQHGAVLIKFHMRQEAERGKSGIGLKSLTKQTLVWRNKNKMRIFLSKRQNKSKKMHKCYLHQVC